MTKMCELKTMLLCFFFNDTATTEIYTLSLHDALPISRRVRRAGEVRAAAAPGAEPWRCRVRGEAPRGRDAGRDRKSTRLNSSHANISYAVFCLKKKRTSRVSCILTTTLACPSTYRIFL